MSNIGEPILGVVEDEVINDVEGGGDSSRNSHPEFLLPKAISFLCIRKPLKMVTDLFLGGDLGFWA